MAVLLAGVQVSGSPCRLLGSELDQQILADLKVSQVWLCPFFSAVS